MQRKKGKNLSEGPNQSLASLWAKTCTFETNRGNLVIESVSTDHIVFEIFFAEFQVVICGTS